MVGGPHVEGAATRWGNATATRYSIDRGMRILSDDLHGNRQRRKQTTYQVGRAVWVEASRTKKAMAMGNIDQQVDEKTKRRLV